MDKDYFCRLGYDPYLSGVLAETVTLYRLDEDQVQYLLLGRKPPNVSEFVLHVFNVCYNRRLAIRAACYKMTCANNKFKPVLRFGKFRRSIANYLCPHTLYEVRCSALHNFIPTYR